MSCTMKLGELKKSLHRFPPDMDDTELIMQYIDSDGEENADLLLYVAYAQLKDDMYAIFLGSWKQAALMIEQGKLDPPEGFVWPSGYGNKNG